MSSSKDAVTGAGGDRAPASGLARRLVVPTAEDESVPPTKPSIAPRSGSPLLSGRPSMPSLQPSVAVDLGSLPTLAHQLRLPLCGVLLGTFGLSMSALVASGETSAYRLLLAASGAALSTAASVVASRRVARQGEALTRLVELASGQPDPGQQLAGPGRDGESTRELELVARALGELWEVNCALEERLDDLEPRPEQPVRVEDGSTRERLEQENADLRRALSRIGRAVLSVDPEGRLSRECSEDVSKWLGPVPHSGILWDYLDQASEGLGLRFESAWGSALGNRRASQLDLRAMPRQMTASGRHFVVEYEPVLGEAGQLDRILVVLSDVTTPDTRLSAEH